MNYEQKYKEALEWMRSIYPTMQGADKEDAEHHFPELRESEDERIRKELYRYFRDLQLSSDREFSPSISVDEILAWLEKQGQEKSIDMNIKEKAHQIAWEMSKHYDPLLSKESWCGLKSKVSRSLGVRKMRMQ